MGCASSKGKVCRNCQSPYSPVRRSSSMQVHHPPQKKGDSYHVVALTSSTLGSLKLDPLVQNHVKEDKDKSKSPLNQNHTVIEDKFLIVKGEIHKEKVAKEELSMGLIEAKNWSKMINEKIPKVIPKTPIRTPPGEPEMVNTWEMMEGLEAITRLRPVHHIPPANPFHLKPLDGEKKPALADKDCALVEEDEKNVNCIGSGNKIVPRDKDKLTVYFTSLRGVRKTYEDCCHVRVILKLLGVKVDERDVSMHSQFKEELKELLGEGFGGGGLPIVFLGQKCIGGAEELRRWNEEGKLEKMVENCETVNNGGGNSEVCEACGDIRFVPCETCSGSCKIYYEGDYDEEEIGESEQEHGFHKCPDCNENGLIRCPVCCD
ncbi:hypothetical protein Pfo_019608 [Paulownia fortunei]|nr:hypothetical protein Pfo_019608 [Paulownia fortunei]